MFSRFPRPRNLARIAILALGAIALAACVPSSTGSGSGNSGPQVDTSRAVPVALLVPKSGGTAQLGANLENAAKMAVRDLNGANLDLKVYDTGGTAAGAAEAARAALGDGAKVILGPLFADSAVAAGAVAAPKGVNVLSFSNTPEVAGGNVFTIGNSFANSANRLADYAARTGVRDIAVVHAQAPQEEQARDAVTRALGANGLRLATVQSFPLSQNGVVQATPGIVREIETSGASGVILTSGNDGALLFLAELLPGAGLDSDRVQMIGIQRIDLPPSARSLPGLQGAWFALPDPNLTAQFENRYAAQYGARPHPVAGLAYDGVAAVGALIRDGGSKPLGTAALTRSSGFLGVGGAFRLRPNRTAERALAVGQIQNGSVVILEPAPRRFGAGS